jgi:putative transposase
MLINKAYKYRIYPNNSQKELLSKHFGCNRWVYNEGIKRIEEYYRESGKYLTTYELINLLPSFKEEHEWLKEVDAKSLQHACLHLNSGYKRFFKKLVGKPKLKSKYNGYQTYMTDQNFGIKNGRLKLPKFNSLIKMERHRALEGKLKSVTVGRVPSGKYYASFLVEQEIEVNSKPIEKESALGLDLGLKDFVITSEGQKFARHKFIKPKKKKLRKLQKKLAKAKKGSNKRIKLKNRIAIIHEKIANKRKDVLHKVSKELVEKNQIYTFCLEDLNVRGMLKNHKLAESISDVSWSEFVRLLKYKADWCGKHVIQIGRFEASSKTCSSCGGVNKELRLSDRIWVCSDCGTEHDRDINAAKNIRAMAFNKSETRVGTTRCNAPGDVGSKQRLGRENLQQLDLVR